jgi:hypothetical protein
MIIRNTLLFVISLLLFSSCSQSNPNINEQGKDQFKQRKVQESIDESEMSFHDVIYVPIYSDIYLDVTNQNNLLAATLSIRNTSFTDSLYIQKIDYYDTEGQKVRSYLDTPIVISEMATVNYVIEREDSSGGPGANFIIELSGKSNDLKPIIQAIMIGEIGNKGFSFSTDGYSLSE